MDENHASVERAAEGRVRNDYLEARIRPHGNGIFLSPHDLHRLASWRCFGQYLSLKSFYRRFVEWLRRSKRSRGDNCVNEIPIRRLQLEAIFSAADAPALRQDKEDILRRLFKLHLTVNESLAHVFTNRWCEVDFGASRTSRRCQEGKKEKPGYHQRKLVNLIPALLLKVGRDRQPARGASAAEGYVIVIELVRPRSAVDRQAVTVPHADRLIAGV